MEASSLDQIKVDKKRLEFDQKNWQRQTLTLELDWNFTTTNVNLWTWPKYGHVHPLRSYSFGHLDQVKWITLNKWSLLIIILTLIILLQDYYKMSNPIELVFSGIFDWS